jgi:hypothetical protein
MQRWSIGETKLVSKRGQKKSRDDIRGERVNTEQTNHGTILSDGTNSHIISSVNEGKRKRGWGANPTTGKKIKGHEITNTKKTREGAVLWQFTTTKQTTRRC